MLKSIINMYYHYYIRMIVSLIVKQWKKEK